MTRPTWDASEHDQRAKHDEREQRDDDATDRDVIEHDPNPTGRGTRLSAGIALLGVVAIVQAVWLDLGPGQFWNDVLVGAALLVAGAYNYFRRSNAELGSTGVAALAAVAGLWLVVSPFLIGPQPELVAAANEIGAWIAVVVGLLAFVLGTDSAISVHKRRREADARGTAIYDRRGQ